MFGLDMETFYKSETPFEVFVLFHNESDGCTYSCQSLISIHLTKEDAEDGLLKCIELAERLDAGNQEFQKRYDECDKSSTTYDDVYLATISRIAEEHQQWSLKNFGHDFTYPLDTNINNYEIESVRIGEIR